MRRTLVWVLPVLAALLYLWWTGAVRTVCAEATWPFRRTAEWVKDWFSPNEEAERENAALRVRLAEAERVIASLQVRKQGVKYPVELIPVRLSEIYQIDEAYEWVEKTVKNLLKKDFQGVEEDVESMQQVVDRGVIGPKKKDQWLALGITLCVIMTNEADGLEWRTLIDGNREVPVLLNTATGQWTDPMKLAWSKVKAGEKVNLAEAYCNA